MSSTFRKLWLAALCLTFSAQAQAQVMPHPEREFRAVWIASVANIDFPTAPGLPAAQQQREMVALLDRAVSLHLNAVILQVRPQCDALYPSALEPWSEFLTGEMGKPPEPSYDVLAFAVEEAHRRGLELHAWFNPYRALHPRARTVSSQHISKRRPDLVRSYGHYLWLDPGEPEVQEETLAVVLDVARRYDVDGIHFDDYFYPYPENDAAGQPMGFPDDASWARQEGSAARRPATPSSVNATVQPVNATGPVNATVQPVNATVQLVHATGPINATAQPLNATLVNATGPINASAQPLNATLVNATVPPVNASTASSASATVTDPERDDWRRHNVDQFIQRVSISLKQLKPYLKFSVSPFGIWRPGHPPQIQGLDAYSKLYADSRRWLQQGWVDDLEPQLYWEIGRTAQSYPVLLNWWQAQNTLHRHVFAGNSISSIGTRPTFTVDEVLAQIRLSQLSRTPGNVLFSARTLLANPGGLDERLVSEVYPRPALTPEYPWIHVTPPRPPAAVLASPEDEGFDVSWPAAGPEVRQRVVYLRQGGSWRWEIVPSSTRHIWMQGRSTPDLYIGVSNVGRTGLESDAKPARITRRWFPRSSP